MVEYICPAGALHPKSVSGATEPSSIYPTAIFDLTLNLITQNLNDKAMFHHNPFSPPPYSSVISNPVFAISSGFRIFSYT